MSDNITRLSERIYSMLVQLYPRTYRQRFGEEMKYVFSESLKDIAFKSGTPGILNLWGRTLLDAIKSLPQQHWDNHRGDGSMKNAKKDLLMQNKIFAWIAGSTALLLLAFLLLAQPTDGVNWSVLDFSVAAVLIFGFASLFVLAARKFKNHRLALGVVIALAFLYLWAELAVGIFTNWGS